MTNSDTRSLRIRAALVNPPWLDPALLIQLPNRSRTVLLDCGELSPLGVGELQRISSVLVSHTHIDHFIGFDRLLRMNLFSPHPITVFGPAGILDQVGAKLQGYAWNLVDSTPFVVQAVEITQHGLRQQIFPGRNQFRGQQPTELQQLPLVEGLQLSTHPVEHGVPCLAYRLDEPRRLRFETEQAAKLGLRPGPWVSDFKEGTLNVLEVDGQSVELNPLRERLLTELPSASLGYLTDTALRPELRAELALFFKQVDELWCEAAFLESESDEATEKSHMTTKEAATLAKEAQVDRLILFHQSRRYEKSQAAHLSEARQLFPSTEDAALFSCGSETPS